MKRVTRNGVIAVAAASGAMAVAVPAWADAGADGIAAGSPGVISGNGIQLPVHVPVNVCGNTVNVVGLLNPAAGNTCVNEGGGDAGHGAPGGSATSGGASAQGAEKGSPGVISGNGVQLPVDVPVSVCGNTVNVVGLLNPAAGNTCVNTSGDHPSPPKHPTPEPPTPEPPTVKPPAEPPAPEPPAPAPPKTHEVPKAHHPAAPPAEATLAHTGTDLTGAAVAGSAALLLAGTALHRRFRPGRTR
ncbi:chaplin [Streptomyces sp. GbtcB6]|uniref:chaplin n=1 Tax=Streptomyces sp. GbtcB6 TaxID=2824751 RepID=UPI001C2FE91F|nr:chaplin [Streptomyces sp. GbtcB6]